MPINFVPAEDTEAVEPPQFDFQPIETPAGGDRPEEAVGGTPFRPPTPIATDQAERFKPDFFSDPMGVGGRAIANIPFPVPARNRAEAEAYIKKYPERATLGGALSGLLGQEEEARLASVGGAVPKFDISEKGTSIPGAVAKEAFNVAIGLPEFLETPAGGAGVVAGAAAHIPTALAFAGYGAKNTADTIANANVNWDQMSTPQKAAFWTVDLPAGLLMTGLPLAGVRPGPALRPRTTTRGVPDASQVRQAAAVHGDVRARETPASTLPEQEGGPGVQPQGTEAAAPETRQQGVLLSDEENAWIDQERKAIDKGENGVQVVDRLHDDPSAPFGPGSNADRRVATIRPDGTIEVHQGNLRLWLDDMEAKGLSVTKRRQAVRSLISVEELNHVKFRDRSLPQERGQFWDDMSAVEKAAYLRSYFGEGVWTMDQARKIDPNINSQKLGYEAMNRFQARVAGMTTREVAEAAFKEKWTVKMLDNAAHAIFRMREAWGTEASGRQRALIDRVTNNIGAARAAVAGGAAPGAFNKAHTEEAERIWNLSPQAFADDVKGRGGPTGAGYDFAEQVGEGGYELLKDYEKRVADRHKELMARAKANPEEFQKLYGDINANAMKSQFFREGRQLIDAARDVAGGMPVAEAASKHGVGDAIRVGNRAGQLEAMAEAVKGEPAEAPGAFRKPSREEGFPFVGKAVSKFQEDYSATLDRAFELSGAADDWEMKMVQEDPRIHGLKLSESEIQELPDRIRELYRVNKKLEQMKADPRMATVRKIWNQGYTGNPHDIGPGQGPNAFMKRVEEKSETPPIEILAAMDNEQKAHERNTLIHEVMSTLPDYDDFLFGENAMDKFTSPEEAAAAFDVNYEEMARKGISKLQDQRAKAQMLGWKEGVTQIDRRLEAFDKEIVGLKEKSFPSAIIRGRSPEVEEGIKSLLAGRITRKEYSDIVAQHKPIEPLAEPPVPATHEEMLDPDMGVKSNSRPVVGKGSEITPGQTVGLRTDLPWKTKTGKAAVVIHSKGSGSKPGTVLAFEGQARIKNPQFIGSTKEAVKIGTGEGRTPFAYVQGQWAPDQGIPEDIKSWTQVGFDPTRHSFYYDRATQQPVIGGSEAMQIGNTVYVKDARFSSPEQFPYAIRKKGGKGEQQFDFKPIVPPNVPRGDQPSPMPEVPPPASETAPGVLPAVPPGNEPPVPSGAYERQTRIPLPDVSGAVERSGFQAPVAKDIDAAATQHAAAAFAGEQIPDFDAFLDDLQSRYGSGMTREKAFWPYADAVRKSLLNASGDQIRAVLGKLGLVDDVAEALNPSDPSPFLRKIPDAPAEVVTQRKLAAIEKPFEPSKWKTPKATRAFLSPEQQRRLAALGAIYDELTARAGGKPKRETYRTQVGPEDVANRFVVVEGGEPIPGQEGEFTQPVIDSSRAIRGFTPDQAADPKLVADAALAGARSSAQKVSLTKGLIALRDKINNRVVLVSAWRDGRRGPVVTNPGGSGSSVKLDADLLKRYEPTHVMTIREPVEDFRQVFTSPEQFGKWFGETGIEGGEGVEAAPAIEPKGGTQRPRWQFQREPGTTTRGPLTAPQAGPVLQQAGLPPGVEPPPPAQAEALTSPESKTARDLTLPRFARRAVPAEAGTPGRATGFPNEPLTGGRPEAVIPPELIPPEQQAKIAQVDAGESYQPTTFEGVSPELASRGINVLPGARGARPTPERVGLERFRKPRKSTESPGAFMKGGKGDERIGERNFALANSAQRKILDDFRSQYETELSDALAKAKEDGLVRPQLTAEGFAVKALDRSEDSSLLESIIGDPKEAKQIFEDYHRLDAARAKALRQLNLEKMAAAGSQFAKDKLSQEYPGAFMKGFQQALGDDIEATKDAVKYSMSKGATTDLIARAYDDSSNLPHNKAREIETGIRHLSSQKPAGKVMTKLRQWERGNPKVLAAANAIVQSGAFQKDGSLDTSVLANKLNEFQAMVDSGLADAAAMKASPSWKSRRQGAIKERAGKQLKEELNYAQEHMGDRDLMRTAKRMRGDLNGLYNELQANGISFKEAENYLPGRYDMSGTDGRGLWMQQPKIFGLKWREPKTFQSYYEAFADKDAAGEPTMFIAATRDGASLVGHAARRGLELIQRNQAVEFVKGLHTPDGAAVAVDPVISPATGSPIAPKGFAGYEAVPMGGKYLAVHPDFAPAVRALWGRSPIADLPIPRAILNFEQLLKHNLLIGDFFHLGRMGYYAASIMRSKAGWRKGWSALDMAERDLPEAVKRGIITPGEAAWSQEKVKFGNNMITRKQLLDRSQSGATGFNVGRVQDALYKDVFTQLTPTSGPIRRLIAGITDPSTGRYNRWLFDKVTRGLMAESLVYEFERQSKGLEKTYRRGAKGELEEYTQAGTHEKLLRDISRDLNNYYGNIGKQGWMKAAWQQDLARMFLLAPQWLEGLVKKEAVGASRLTGLSKVMGKREGLSAIGTTGRGIGTGILFMLGVTQAINLITRGKPTWKNDEKGHKFDAWIPIGGGRNQGMWLSPLSLFAEITHDVYRLSETRPTVMSAIDQIAGNKESPLLRAALIGLTGESQGQRYTSSAGQLKGVAKALAPVPITFGKLGQFAGHAIAPGTVPPVAPGTLPRSFLGSLGIKAEPAQSALSQAQHMAEDFLKKNDLKKDTGWQQVMVDEPGYTRLRTQIRNGDNAGAARTYKALLKNRKESDITKAMKLWAKHPLAGKNTKNFLSSLSDKELDTVTQANEERQALLEKYYDWVNQQP